MAMVHDGQTLNYLRGTGSPLMAHELGIVAAAFISGIKPSSEKPLLDTVCGEDAAAVREFAWSFNAESKADFADEQIGLNEFVRRFNDVAWREANPEHPISYMAAMWDQLCRLRTDLRALKPLLKLQKQIDDGDELHIHTVLISQDASAEERADFLEAYNAAG
jgi:hypothetical protein